MERRGLEPLTSSLQSWKGVPEGVAPQGLATDPPKTPAAAHATRGGMPDTDPRLAMLADAWAELPEPIRVSIAALVQAARVLPEG